MDETDERIMALLARDGRASLESIAKQVGLRRPSVHARVRRLEADGVIRGYAARLDPRAVGAPVMALAFLRLAHGKGKDCLAACAQVAQDLQRLPEVLEVHTLAGDEDAVVKLRAASMEDLERLVMREISGLAGVERVRTSIVLSTQLERPLAPAVTARRRRPRA